MKEVRVLGVLGALGLSAVLSLSACASKPAEAPITAHTYIADPFPAPFTGDEIRAATKAGRMYRFRVDAKGKPPTFRTVTFANVTPEGAEIRSTHTTANGEEVTPASKSKVTWRDLQSHGEFPRQLVTRGEETVDLGALGTVKTVKYTVASENGEREVFCFDLARPGAPVMFFHEEKGERTIVTTLVAYSDG